MKLNVLLLLCGSILHSAAAVFTSNTVIGATDTTYDGLDLVISNCTVTVDGPHTFNSVRVAAGGALTHSNSPDGQVSITSPVLDEPQILTSTNPVTLVNSNIVLSSVL